MKQKQRISIIGSAGIPANYGGFETLTHNLSTNLDTEFDLTVYCSTKNYPRAVRMDKMGNTKLKYVPLSANGLQSIPYDLISIARATFHSDTLLILGVSGAICLPFLRLFTKKNLIVHIDGLEWRRNKWGKMAKIFLKSMERIAVKNAHKVIADNEAIADYTIKEYGVKSTIIEYGGDNAAQIPTLASKDTEGLEDLVKTDYYFSVARIEPENNIHVLLEAFNESNKRLIIVGNWKSSEYGRHLQSIYGATKNIHLLDPIYDKVKLGFLRSNTKCYLHGHSAGGTNPSLVEAMHLGLPIVAFDVVFNRKTMENKGHYFKDAKSLESLLKDLTPSDLFQMGIQMRKIALRRYTWEKIASKYSALFLDKKKLKSQNLTSDLDSFKQAS